MATETNYNVIKVQELRQISSATGADELIINDVDSIPLETKKITAENFAYSIKDYILPIASAEILGGIRVGQGLSINPANGVLRNDIYYINDLHDVQVTNPQFNQVLSYDGVKWANAEFPGVRAVVAGDGLSGGGDNGTVILNVNPGDGLSIENDRVNVNTGIGLTTSLDIVYVDANDSLTFEGNKLSVNPGRAIVLDDFGTSVNYGRGLTLFGPLLEVYLGKGLEFASGNQVTPSLGNGLHFDGHDIATNLGKGLKFTNSAIEADLGPGLEFVNDQIAASLGTGMEFVNGKIDVVGKGDLTITQGGGTLGKFNANQEENKTIEIPPPGNGRVTIKYGGNRLNDIYMNQGGDENVNIPAPGNGRVRILQNGSLAGTFYANQSGNTDVNITVKDGADGQVPTDYGAVGTYLMTGDNPYVRLQVGNVIKGPLAMNGSNGLPPGNWRLMGWRHLGGHDYTLLWVRIS